MCTCTAPHMESHNLAQGKFRETVVFQIFNKKKNQNNLKKVLALLSTHNKILTLRSCLAVTMYHSP